MNLGQDFANKLALIKNTCGLSHAEFLIVRATYRGNNWYTDGEIEREVVGEPVAEYVKPYLPTITRQIAQTSLDRLLADGFLRRCSGKDIGASRDGYCLTPEGMKLGFTLDALWRDLYDPTFTRGEYWLLELVVTFRVSVASLLAPDIEEVYNKPGHGMNRQRLEYALESLAKRGLIAFSRTTLKGELAVSDFSAAFDEPASCREKIYYGLTSHGGAQWEAFAAPSWDKFIDASSCPDGEEILQHEVFGASRERLQRVFDGLHYVGVVPKPETVRWTELAPWQATYWKQLPKGYRVEFVSSARTDFHWDDVPLSYYWMYCPRWYRWE